MAEIHQLEVETKCKSSAERFYALMTRDAPKLPKYAPQTILNVQVFPRDGEVRGGSIFVWEYVPRDNPFVALSIEKVTAVDPKNLSITTTVLEGDLTNGYTSFVITLAITPTKRDGNYNFIVKWVVQYVKANEDVPDPTNFMIFLEEFTKELDNNLLKEE
ncbi:MLP-like protein 43 [Papaver somniferum]|uniref:MLP-like protein 43 n=1 Tax=Papaver somniferum TaxID=3469 RepID=UPI000E6FA39B|nr:MLP-like protein 43 [Papaver somniferum]